jgi:hypothetical protein
MRAVILLTAVIVGAVAVAAQDTKSMPHHQMPAKTGATMTQAQKIANAMTAAPLSISGKATMLDWPADEKSQPLMLRTGTNGWTCLPDMPDTKGNDPMCMDEPWMKWVEAYMAKRAPSVGRVGIGYMLAPGGAWGSNTDPYAMKETSDNHWGHHNPHMMIVVPDVKALDGISTDPSNGGPYVMYAGTPYAHIMAPITSTMTASK